MVKVSQYYDWKKGIFMEDPLLERFLVYSQDNDPNGAQGHELADEFVEKFGTLKTAEILRHYCFLKEITKAHKKVLESGFEHSQVSFLPHAV